NAAGGAQVAAAFTGSAGAFRCTAKIYSGTTLSAKGQTTTAGTIVAGVTSAVDRIEVDGFVQVGTLPGNEGTLTVQFAQNASFGKASSVLVGSSLMVREADWVDSYFP